MYTLLNYKLNGSHFKAFPQFLKIIYNISMSLFLWLDIWIGGVNALKTKTRLESNEVYAHTSSNLYYFMIDCET